MGKFNAVPTIDFDVEGRPEIPTFEAGNLAGVKVPQVKFNPSFNPFNSNREISRKPARQWEKLYEKAAASPSSQNTQNIQTFFQDSQEEMSSQHFQYKGQYILTAVQSGLMMVDQRRAHIRILYERYLKQMQEHNAATQGLLFPELLELSPSDAALLTAILDDVRALGFDITSLGGNSFSIVGTPSGQVNPVAVVQQMVESVKMQDGGHTDALHHQLALVLARNNAIEVGEVLTPVQMEAIIGDLFQCDNPNLSPSGKTILTILQQETIDKMFKTP